MMEPYAGSIAVVVAFAADRLFGELPNRWHPVAWMGSVISALGGAAPTSGRVRPLAAGFVIISSGVAACAVIGWQIEKVASWCPWGIGVLMQAIVLKQTFSINSLASAATAIMEAMRGGDLATARQQLAFHLVSRDVSELDASQTAAATIESVAENTSDSVVAPLFYYAIAGLAGALAYRFVNTCDAMMGYRTARYEWLGKPAARMDDLLNLIPARLTALIILAVGGMMFRQRPFAGASVWLRDRRATASPNAGHPMSAAAGVLDVELEKVGHYRLGSGQRPPSAADIARAVGLLRITSAIAAVAAGLWLLWDGVI